MLYLEVNVLYPGKKNIDIGGLFQLSDTHVDWWTYSQSFPVIIDAAFDEINNNPSILPDHTLRLVSRDTQVGDLEADHPEIETNNNEYVV